MKPLFFSKSFFPDTFEGEKPLYYFRTRAISGKSRNLIFLLESRYEWMKAYVTRDQVGVELGAGIGVTKRFLDGYKLELTDCYHHDWLDKVVDAMDMPYPDNSLDYIIASNVIHHIAYPVVFLNEVKRVLKPGGYLLINDVNCGLLMRLLLKTLKHEGYSYNKDVFSRTEPVNHPNEPWSGNNAVCDLLFNDRIEFFNRTGLSIIKDQPDELFTFLLSGGVSSEFKTIQLPIWALKLFQKLDYCLSNLKSIFPLSRKTVILKPN